ncbi:hypothetical protein F5Y16DRAFT_2173 [Xylariaceae sp. FL0255]|nr:hypothetical protein F5Y16DRAFT_2173 [Xylariaceae sp. FL0255]
MARSNNNDNMPLLQQEPTAKDLLREAYEMQAELQEFGDHLDRVYDGYFNDFPKNIHRRLSSELAAALKDLQCRVESGQSTAGSNFIFTQGVWEVAKRSKNIVMLTQSVNAGRFEHRRQYFAPGERLKGLHQQPSAASWSQKRRPDTRVVDVICDGGSTWTKVSSVSNSRLLFDMANEAVYVSDNEDEEKVSKNGMSADYSDVPIAKQVRFLKKVAEGHRFKGKSPSLNVFLPRIFEHEHPQIHQVVEVCRRMGTNVFCGDALPPAEPLTQELLSIMVPGPRASLTPVLNIDTSVLIALVSDYCHFTLPDPKGLPRAIADHIALEREEQFLPRICSVLGDRDLTCTRQAADTFTEIVHHIGRDTENARAHLLFAIDDNKTSEQRVEELHALSDQPSDFLSTLRLPIRVFNMTEEDCQAVLSPELTKVLNVLEQPTRSVFASGWARNTTTVTTNMGAVKEFEKSLELATTEDSTFEWPSIWAFPNSRPLRTVPRGSNEPRILKHIGDCRVACTCGLERKLKQDAQDDN